MKLFWFREIVCYSEVIEKRAYGKCESGSAHLNSVSRHFAGWDILQFKVEEADEQNRGRKIDLVPVPCGAAIYIEGRRFTDFELIMPIECKRLPTPKEKDRDEREYVFSQYSSTCGIQRFKEGNHGAAHGFGGMIGYVQEGTTSVWKGVLLIGSLVWLASTGLDLRGLAVFGIRGFNASPDSLAIKAREEKGLARIELRQLWIEMSEGQTPMWYHAITDFGQHTRYWWNRSRENLVEEVVLPLIGKQVKPCEHTKRSHIMFRRDGKRAAEEGRHDP